MSVPKYSIGDRVLVNNTFEYRGKCHLKCGEVLKVFKKHDRYLYGIKIDGLPNPRSEAGVYWFGVRSLEVETTVVINESEENIMFENYSVARISFLDNPNTVFPYALYDSDIKEGDTVVVHTANHGFALAKVTSIDGTENARKEVKSGREIVCKVDFSNYNYRQDSIRRMKELKCSMDAKLREAQTLAIYEMFAEKDPALKEMLEEFKSLSSAIKGETDE